MASSRKESIEEQNSPKGTNGWTDICVGLVFAFMLLATIVTIYDTVALRPKLL